MDPDRARRSAFVLSAHHEPTTGTWHAHDRAQLVYGAQGVLTVHTPHGRWISPPHRAIWIPGGTPHRVSALRSFQLATLYVCAQRAPLGAMPQVVHVDRLMSALLDSAASFGPDYPVRGPQARLVQVILDQIRRCRVVAALQLPEPQSAALRKLTGTILGALNDARTLPQLCAGSGMSARTAARRFQQETGMTFGRWRQQARLQRALELLAGKMSVSDCAYSVGYEDVSAFITMFRDALGVTPSRYFAQTEPEIAAPEY